MSRDVGVAIGCIVRVVSASDGLRWLVGSSGVIVSCGSGFFSVLIEEEGVFVFKRRDICAVNKGVFGE